MLASRLRTIVLPALVGVGLLVPAGAAGAAAPEPQLSITIDDGRVAAAAGDSPAYTITVANLGSVPVTGLRLTQSLPPGLVFGSADSAGTADSHEVAWNLDLERGARVSLRTTMTVTDTAPEVLRLATVACVRGSAAGPPIVCSSDSNLLPAGAAAAETAAKAAQGGPAAPAKAKANRGLVIAAGGTIVVLAAALGLRRRAGRSDRDPATTAAAATGAPPSTPATGGR